MTLVDLTRNSFKRILSTFCLVIILAVAGFFASKFLFQARANAKEFVGSVQKVEGNLLFAKGLFITLDRPELTKGGFTKDVEIEVSPETEIIKIIMYMPTREQLKETGGKWNPAELKKEEKPGALSDLTHKREGITIKVTAGENIFNKSKFKAKKIEYVLEVYPDRPVDVIRTM